MCKSAEKNVYFPSILMWYDNVVRSFTCDFMFLVCRNVLSFLLPYITISIV